MRLLISLIILIVAITLVFLAVSPLWSAVVRLKTEIVEKEKGIAKIEELLSKTEQLKKEYQETEEAAQKVLLSLPKEEDIPYLLVQFESLASTNGLLLSSVKFNPIVEEKKKSVSALQSDEKISGDFPKSLINMKLSGSYDAFKSFLSALENSVRIIDVQLIKFNAPGDTALVELGVFEFDLDIVVYYGF